MCLEGTILTQTSQIVNPRLTIARIRDRIHSFHSQPEPANDHSRNHGIHGGPLGNVEQPHAPNEACIGRFASERNDLSIHPLKIYDRSRVVTDWNCRRQRFYAYEYEGKGLTSAGMHLELYLGTVLHDALSGIAQGVCIDDLATAAKQQLSDAIISNGAVEPGIELFAAEQCALTEGLIRGFHRHVWPALIEQYPNVVAVEQEMAFRHDIEGQLDPNGDFLFMSKPDLILEDKEGNLFYIEYKSTSSNKDAWVNSWQDAVQLHSTCRAVEATLGRPVTAVVVQGLYKGYSAYNKQNSPFCYSYHRPGVPPFNKAEFRYDYMGGFKKYPTWMMPNGVKGWVEGMSDQLLAEQFPRTPPIFINESLIDAFFRQRAEREMEIHAAREGTRNNPQLTPMLLDMSFPQSFDKCRPSFGKGCQFRGICHGSGVPDQIGPGERYDWRKPHHDPEVELQKASVNLQPVDAGQS